MAGCFGLCFQFYDVLEGDMYTPDQDLDRQMELNTLMHNHKKSEIVVILDENKPQFVYNCILVHFNRI